MTMTDDELIKAYSRLPCLPGPCSGDGGHTTACHVRRLQAVAIRAQEEKLPDPNEERRILDRKRVQARLGTKIMLAYLRGPNPVNAGVENLGIVCLEAAGSMMKLLDGPNQFPRTKVV